MQTRFVLAPFMDKSATRWEVMIFHEYYMSSSLERAGLPDWLFGGVRLVCPHLRGGHMGSGAFDMRRTGLLISGALKRNHYISFTEHWMCISLPSNELRLLLSHLCKRTSVIRQQ
jgi:hypothetical protein